MSIIVLLNSLAFLIYCFMAETAIDKKEYGKGVLRIIFALFFGALTIAALVVGK
jgi:hypothetical protein